MGEREIQPKPKIRFREPRLAFPEICVRKDSLSLVSATRVDLIILDEFLREKCRLHRLFIVWFDCCIVADQHQWRIKLRE